MKKLSKIIVASLLLVMSACSSKEAGTYIPGTYTGEGQGFGGTVTVTITTDENSITEVTVTGDSETANIGGAQLENLGNAILEAQSAEIDVVSGATLTSNGVIEAAKAAIEAAKGGSTSDAELAYTAGTYTGTAQGYNGPVSLDVTFSEDAITDIQINTSTETEHVGTPAFDIMIADAIAANGSGIDMVSGATFTSRAIKDALNDAATQAEATNMDAFKANTVEHQAEEKITKTADIIVVGAGGAGMTAAAQAAQNGDTVIVVEQNAEIGGNTLVSGGAYQSVMPYLVWDEADPDATTGEYNGTTYDKVLANAGTLDTLRTIAEWSEEEFDGTIDEDHPFTAGEIVTLSQRGVHQEYLPTLQTLKKQINAYLDWADAQLAAGKQETELTLFSTKELHVFQTYYGGLRPNAEKTDWVYSDYELVQQMVDEGQGIKEWLVAQGAKFDDASQPTLIGCLWQRENSPIEATVDGETYAGNWGVYFVTTENTLLSANDANEIMLRTTANELISDDTGRVVGVKATRYDGTEVELTANKGVILATGGYAANINMVIDTNDYWDSEYLTDQIGTTNRNSLQGSGIEMATALNAATTGEEWTQLMPLGWLDTGNLAFGSGDNVIFINPTTGLRYVDEMSERDVLSEAAFENGIEKLGKKGTYIEISNGGTTSYGGQNSGVDQTADVENKVYYRDLEGAAELLGIDKEVLEKTITDYDMYVMGETDSLDVPKSSYKGTIGNVEQNEDGTYNVDTYEIGTLKIRYMAPSTHHTMGGLLVDLDRHVLDEDGNVIEGLYAAGEVTGGIHGGNRLGGNAIVEIIVSGRIAANAAH